METKDVLQLKYPQIFVDCIANIKTVLGALEREHQKENPKFRMAPMWGWHDFKGFPEFFTTEHCRDVMLNNEISKIIDEELNKIAS